MNDLKERLFFLYEFKVLFALLFCIFCIGILGQYNAFYGTESVFVQRYILRIVIGVGVMFVVYLSDFRVWKDYAYVFYALILFALVVVEMLGLIRLGAQRWIDLYFVTVQPSEFMKIALIMALSRYYSQLTPLEISDVKNHILPFAMTLLPTILVLKQPDLGTASLLFCSGIGIIFVSGFPLKAFVSLVLIAVALCPFGWFSLHDYQKRRILTFLDPERDPSGSGYHVLQSKIAIGSGGIFGRGFLCGTQSKLNFLPEKNTDFIFTTIAEETGFIGSIIIIMLFVFTVMYFIWIGSNVRSMFSRHLCYGLSILFFMHMFINIAMVMGLVPVVGIPLPFLSYGGSATAIFSVGCGLVMSAMAYRKKY